MSAIDLTIDSIAAGGDGVGRHDGIVVFVPRAAPGDKVRVEVGARRTERLMRGVITEVEQPSGQRTDPKCPHYTLDNCGGCQLQHLDYARGQLPAKSRIIGDALERIGRARLSAAPDVEPSPRQWRYRTKLTLALRRTGNAWIAGLRRYDDPDAVFQLQDCLITDERVVEVWRQVLRQAALLPAASALRGAVRLLEDSFSFTLEGASEWPAHDRFFASLPELSQLYWKPEGKGRRLLASRDARGAGASFTQVNPEVASRLRDFVMELANGLRPRVVVDAYSGTGDVAVALAQGGARVTAIEIDRDASRLCAERLPEGSRAIAAPVERALPAALPADLVVLNPPRTGLDERVPRQLQTAGELPRALIYVSCNPATLARDIRRLDRYHVRTLRGFDMFPQTAHVETVCELVPAA